MKGNILCRLMSDSREIRDLGNHFMQKLKLSDQIYFVVQDEHDGDGATHIPIKAEIINKMITQGYFQIEHCVHLTSKVTCTHILLSLGRYDLHPISQFPRSLLRDQENTLSKQLVFRSRDY